MKSQKSIIILLIAILTFTSCSDWLEVPPEDGVIRDQFWKTKEETLSSLMGCYISLKGGSTSSEANDCVKRYFVWGELRADMAAPLQIVQPTQSQKDPNLLELNTGEISTLNTYTDWSLFYRTINQCNTVIEFSPIARKKDLSFSEKLMKQYIAEAECIRSLTYFYLLRTFRDVPYITQASIYDSQDYLVSQTSQTDIVDSLIVTLERIDQENTLPSSYNSVVFTKGRFTKWAMKALLADLYLWKSDYANCIYQCNQIIESGQFSLISVGIEKLYNENLTTMISDTANFASEGDIDNLFTKVYGEGNSTESIFELQYSLDDKLSNPFFTWFGSTKSNVAQILPNMTNMRGVFFPESLIDRNYYDVRSEKFSYNSAGNIWKHIGKTRLEGYEGSSYTNWIFYRLADVILMKAEALAQEAIIEGDNQSKLLDAQALLFEIRNIRNATETSNPFYKQSGSIEGKTIEKAILMERAREFCFEGKRWFDVLRHARRNNYSPENLKYLEDMSLISTSPEKVGSLQNKWLNNFGSHYLPINADELKRNSKLVQNEFYK
ncbi:MAG: RagB/SusD family nutrient uptake outer membrane protein [Paludibacter sp.]|nr:RagB/SusD family nutrient uptake outer membrane protein [Paludibacter sp.]